MVVNLVRRFWEITNQEGIGSALQSTQRYLFNKERLQLFQLWKIRLIEGEWSIIREINGSKMRLDIRPASPNSLERTLALESIREPGATNVFQDVLMELKNQVSGTIHVFDVGANVGYFALLEARILEQKGHIYAIEAEPNNAERLKYNIELNDYSNIEVLQIAIGAERAQLELARRSSSNVHRMSDILGDKEAVSMVDVEVHSLDSLVAENDIAKDDLIIDGMESEGYEERAFEGMSELLSSDQSMYIFTEIHPPRSDPVRIADMLAQNHFHPEYISFDGGDTYQKMDSIDNIREIESNAHIMLSWLNCGGDSEPANEASDVL